MAVSTERAQELQNHIEDESFKTSGWFTFVKRLTRDDVDWIIEYYGRLRLRIGDVRPDPLELSYKPIEARPSLANATLRGLDLSDLDLDGWNLHGAKLAEANLRGTRLVAAILEDAVLRGADLCGANLTHAWLAGADLRFSFLDERTLLNGANLLKRSDFRTIFPHRGSICVSGVRWNGAFVTESDLRYVERLGDDVLRGQGRPLTDARWRQTQLGGSHAQVEYRVGRDPMLVNYLTRAIQAYEGLAKAMRECGDSTTAARLQHRARQLNAQKLTAGFKPGVVTYSTIWSRAAAGAASLAGWLKRGISALIDAVCGYGFKPFRILATYLIAVGCFALVYLLVPSRDYGSHRPTAWNAFWMSLIAFHGRGLVNGSINVDSGILWVPALEAGVGLFVEAIFVAVLIRRLFQD